MSILLFLSQREDLLEKFIKESSPFFGEPISIASYRYADSEAICFYLGNNEVFNSNSLENIKESSLQIELIRLRNIFSEFKVDILFLNSFLDSKKESLFVFDMDSTLIQGEVIDELARRNGKYQEVSNVTRQTMEGDLSFDDSLRLRVAYLKGLPDSVFSDIYNNINLNWGVEKFLIDVKSNNLSKIAVLSGGFSPILEKFSHDFNLDYFEGNHLEIKDSLLTGKILGSIVNKERKKNALIELSQKYSIPISQTISVGDGANDTEMILHAGIGIGFHAKQGLKNNILNWIDYNSMECLMLLFGPSL